MLTLATMAVGCGPQPSRPPATASPAGTVSATARPTPLKVDPSLIEFLPTSLDELPVEFSPDASADATASAGLDGIGTLAYAVTADESSGDLVIATVLRPAVGPLDEPAFRAIRETYDASVCAEQGGVRGSAQAELGGRTVHIGTCGGGGHTYHARLERSGVIVSAFSRGERRLGEQLMSALRDR